MIRYTLISDGSSDTVLLPILNWLMGQLTSERFSGEWADLRILPGPPRTLRDRVRVAIDLYPCEILMVHRDAELEPIADRTAEIRGAVGDMAEPPVVCVVPVRMQEAWLLFDEGAIRTAAGKPRSRIQLRLPAIRRLENEADPKETLYNLLETASGLSGRRLHKFKAKKQVHRVARLITDYSPIRELPAFVAMERELRKTLQELEGMRSEATEDPREPQQ